MNDVMDKWVAGTLLSRMDAPMRTALLRVAPASPFPKGTVLIGQDDPLTDFAFILRSGTPDSTACVKVTGRLADGRDGLLGIRLSGDIVGELGALHRQPRSATVTACSKVWAHKVPAMTLLAFLQENPQAWLALNATIADRLQWANQRRLDFAGFPVHVRLARLLLVLSDQHGRRVEPSGTTLGVALSHEELGMLIGAGKDAVYQAVSMLKRDGLIISAYRSIVITDEAGLRRAAEPDVSV
ncbi:Crp/Fnr family transcriptional regulator [Actinomadura monticuli]|uniref:Crp/Fnr family transcriptional regulator n=1 Tax=Actinomadura monticuli TaxID=3097367 RepID=A0ABV4QJR8_9ACTN